LIQHLSKLDFKSILDLGCGNGLLLDKIAISQRREGQHYDGPHIDITAHCSCDINVYGLDTEDKLIVKLDRFTKENIFMLIHHDDVYKADVIMISYERFLESKDCMGLFNKLLATTNKYLVITSYNGNACRYPFDNSNGIEILRQKDGENTITVYRKPLYEDK
jgi:hypothetical protein